MKHFRNDMSHYLQTTCLHRRVRNGRAAILSAMECVDTYSFGHIFFFLKNMFPDETLSKRQMF